MIPLLKFISFTVLIVCVNSKLKNSFKFDDFDHYEEVTDNDYDIQFDDHNCKKYEYYSPAGPQCPQTCDWLNRECTLKIASRPGCFCQKGYVREERNRCVRGNKYCGKCDCNEYFTMEGPNCDAHCETLNQPCTNVYKMKPSGCFCKEGYARNKMGHCVEIRKCFRSKKTVNF